ncbi:MarR family transcriptional regulator, partial [Sphingorhabdus sp.]|uniref:MarR family transcriptional regulator n=1 Tax=Sphingorhabdus sp. TaxID=1902408 RepID=UPI003593D936
MMREVEEAAGRPDLPAGEGRVLYQIVCKPSTQADLARELSMDTGLLNRRVKRLKQKNLVISVAEGGRRQLLRATPQGQHVSSEARSQKRVIINQVLAKMSPTELGEFYAAAACVGEYGDGPSFSDAIQYREPRPGEMTYVLESIVGTEDDPNEYGFDKDFEGYVLQALTDVAVSEEGEGKFVLIAEMHGRIVGTIICLGDEDGVMHVELLTERLRILKNDIGASLIAEAIKRARTMGYKNAVATAYGD